MSDNVSNLMDAWLKKRGLGFSFIPNSKGYPLYKDPAAGGGADAKTTPAVSDLGIRYLRNHYGPAFQRQP